MNSTLGIIIFVIYVVVHIVSAIRNEAAKKKQKEKAMAEAERRRIAEAHLEPPPVDAAAQPDPFFTPAPPRRQGDSAATVGVPVPMQRRTGTVVDDQAAKRKAQLDKLRMGRPIAERPSNPPRGEVKRPALTPNPIKTPQRDDIPIRQERERKLRAQAKTQAQNRLRDAEASARRQSHTQSSPDVDAPTTASRATAPGAKTATQVAAGARRGSPAILKRMKSRAALRELFILKEMIDPPLSLRSQI